MWKTVFLFGIFLVSCCAANSLFRRLEGTDVQDEDVVAAANYASKQLVRNFPGPYHYKLAKIFWADKQVVGDLTKYELLFSLGKTTCKKSEVQREQLEDCDFQENDNINRKCFIVMSKDNNDKYRIQSSACVST